MPLGFGKAIFSRSAPAAGVVPGLFTSIFQSQLDMSVALGSDAKFDDNKINTDSLITVGGSDTEFTVTETGRYYINACVSFNPTAASFNDQYTQLLLKKNGTQIGRGSVQTNAASAYAIVRGMVQGYFDLAANDVITVDTNSTYTTNAIVTTDNIHNSLIIAKMQDTDEIHVNRTNIQEISSGTSFSGGITDSRYYKLHDILWNNEVTKEAGFTHSNVTSENEIQLDASGRYFVSTAILIQNDGMTGSTGGTEASTVCYLECDDANYGGDNAGTFKNTGIVSAAHHRHDGSPQTHVDHNLIGVLNVSAQCKVRIRMAGEHLADTGRAMKFDMQTGSYCRICKMTANDNVFVGLLADEEPHSTLPSSDRSLDFTMEVAKDSAYTHSNVTDPHEITLAQGHRYLVFASQEMCQGVETAAGGDSLQVYDYRLYDVTNGADVITNAQGGQTRLDVLVGGGYNYQDDDLGNADGVDGGLASRGQDGMELFGVSIAAVADATAAATTFDLRYKMVAATTAGKTNPSDDPNYNVQNTTGSTLNGVANNDYGFGTHSQRRGIHIVRI